MCSKKARPSDAPTAGSAKPAALSARHGAGEGEARDSAAGAISRWPRMKEGRQQKIYYVNRRLLMPRPGTARHLPIFSPQEGRRSAADVGSRVDEWLMSHPHRVRRQAAGLRGPCASWTSGDLGRRGPPKQAQEEARKPTPAWWGRAKKEPRSAVERGASLTDLRPASVPDMYTQMIKPSIPFLPLHSIIHPSMLAVIPSIPVHPFHCLHPLSDAWFNHFRCCRLRLWSQTGRIIGDKSGHFTRGERDNTGETCSFCASQELNNQSTRSVGRATLPCWGARVPARYPGSIHHGKHGIPQESPPATCCVRHQGGHRAGPPKASGRAWIAGRLARPTTSSSAWSKNASRNRIGANGFPAGRLPRTHSPGASHGSDTGVAVDFVLEFDVP